MKQPDSLDSGTKMDVAKYRLQTAREDFDTANLTFSSKEITAQQLLILAAEYLDKSLEEHL